MSAYSQNLRQQVLRAMDEGKSQAQIIERFQVSRATIKRYVKQQRETGNVLPRPIMHDKYLLLRRAHEPRRT